MLRHLPVVEIICRGTPLSLGILVALLVPLGAASQSTATDSVLTPLLGDWRGEGTYEGDRLSLTRGWTAELGGTFVKADMQVTMASGARFGAIMFWKVVGDGAYRAIWMDGTGRVQELDLALTPGVGVRAEYLDRGTGSTPEWRRWEFDTTGPDTYVERLFAYREGRWDPLASFSFERVSSR